MSNKFLYSGCVLAALIIVGAPRAAGAEPPQAAMTVVRDAETGTLRAATPAERRALQAGQEHLQWKAPASQTVVLPNGTHMAHLGERGMLYSVVTRGPDGKLKHQCIDAKEHAAMNDTGAVPVPNVKEHHHEHQ